MIDFAPPWLPEWDAAALELWDSGLSSPKCAALLTDRFGHHFTHDAVYNRIKKLKKRGVLLPVPLAGGRLETPPHNGPPSPGKTLMELGKWECHYEITNNTNRRDFRFCAEPVVGDKAYRWCEKHRGTVYTVWERKNGRV